MLSTSELTEAMNSITRNKVCMKGNVVTQWPIYTSRNLQLRLVRDSYSKVKHP